MSAALSPREVRPDASEAADAAPGAFEPYTVDRWVAKPRRPAAPRAVGRSAVTEPITPTPLPDPPKIEMFRGGNAMPVAK
jgi:hypothetical protein